MSDWYLDDEAAPKVIIDTMREIYVALQNNLLRLVTMGIRATLDRVMVDKIGDCGNFVNKLDALQKADYLSQRQRNDLEIILEAGHAAAHRGWAPTEQQITTLLDITESLIANIYMHGPRAERLGRQVPMRPKPKKS
jgi:hypothetical protein